MEDSKSGFEPVIGLEIHAQISTKSKMFCGCSNDSFGAPPNSNVCPICMGFPGMLPVINETALEKGIAAALALHCDISPFSKFDRKNYFYPDLPKGFQISQYDTPISKNGYVEVERGGEVKKIRVNRLHLEDDAGKLTHTAAGTLCDFNRSGSPLMEIVSEPDITSIEEASAYAEEVRRILRCVGASECDMEKGMMRFDINVSLRPKGDRRFGTKVEVKNLNSFRSLQRALAYEISRQAEVLHQGGSIVQETRGWDDSKALTLSQRSKEEAHDYRYFPEPDLPPVTTDSKAIEALRESVPELPLARKKRFIKSYGLSVEDAALLTEDRTMADYFEEAAARAGDAKKTAAFIGTILLQHLNREGKKIQKSPVSASNLGALLKLVSSGAISNNMAKGEIFEEMYLRGDSPEVVVKKKGLELISDASAIESICRKILDGNPGPVADFKGGKEAALGFLVGKVMKETKGQASPVLVNEIFRKLLK